MFNCNRCSFELQQGDLTTLPESEALDLKSMLNQTTIGRVKIAPEKGTLFIDRVEFPNEWKVGDEHGLIHDGLQVYAAHTHSHHPLLLSLTPSSSHTLTRLHALSDPAAHTPQEDQRLLPTVVIPRPLDRMRLVGDRYLGLQSTPRIRVR